MVEIKKAILNEFEKCEFGTMQELIERGFKPVKKKSEIVIENIVINKKENHAMAFIPIKNKGYYFRFDFSFNKKFELYSVSTEPGYNISYSINSEKYTVEDLLNMTLLKPTRKIRKDDIIIKKRNVRSIFNSITFGEDSKGNRFDIKLIELIDYLYTDYKNIKKLAQKTNSHVIWLGVCFDGMYPLTSLSIDKDTIKKIAKMDLKTVFDIYAW